jgi:hypothetical protein
MPKTANARQSDGTDAALVATLISSNETTDGKQPANMVDGLFAIARAIEGLAVHVKYLGEVLLAGSRSSIRTGSTAGARGATSVASTGRMNGRELKARGVEWTVEDDDGD